MGVLVTYEEFKEYQRKKKYGDRLKGFKGRGFPEDYNMGPDENTFEDPTHWLAAFFKKDKNEE